jgi:hypothetical protein
MNGGTTIMKNENRTYGTTSMPQIDTTICVGEVAFIFRGSPFAVIAAGIEGGHAYAATKPRNEIIERAIISKIEFGFNGNFAPTEVQSELQELERDKH